MSRLKPIIFALFFMLLGGVITYGIVKFPQSQKKTKPEIVATLNAMMQKFNSETPLMMDKLTRLDSTLAAPEIPSFSYRYTVLKDMDAGERKHMFEGLEQQIKNQVQTSPDMDFFRNNRIGLNYIYSDKTGKEIGRVVIKPEDYKNPVAR